MREKSKGILASLFLLLFVLLVSSFCYISIRYTRKFKSLESTLNKSRDTVVQLGERIGQQESIINTLKERQSDLERVTGELSTELESAVQTVERTTDTLKHLTDIEQNVDGYTGAVRGTVDKVHRAVELTIQGITEEGITN